MNKATLSSLATACAMSRTGATLLIAWFAGGR
jgi:hypothetical protein